MVELDLAQYYWRQSCQKVRYACQKVMESSLHG
jgi:hypothetical protein